MICVQHSPSGIPVYQFTPLPTDRLLHAWFKDNEQQFLEMFSTVKENVLKEQREIQRLRGRVKDVMWWNPRGMDTSEGLTFVESSHGDTIKTVRSNDTQGSAFQTQLFASLLAQVRCLYCIVE